MEEKISKITIAKSGGTSINSYSGKVTIAKSWLDKLGINNDNRDIKITLDKKKIIIEKQKKERQ